MHKHHVMPLWDALPAGAVLVFYCQCGEGCPPVTWTARDLIEDLRAQDITCDCCGELAEVLAYTTDRGEFCLQVDLGDCVVYVPRVTPPGSPIEVLTSAGRSRRSDCRH
jgi:hypothetical protein